jgi:SAM-dependent methyltransferase
MSAEYSAIQVGGGNTAQPIALRKRLRHIREHLVPGRSRFLDCGCGTGDYVFALVDGLGLDAHGVEYEAEKAARGQAHPRHGARIQQGDIQDLRLPSEEWDYAMLNEVLEHVPDEPAALREVWRVLRPGGLLFLFSPNRWFPFEAHGVHLRHSGKRIPHWVPFIPYIPLRVGTRVLDYWARNYWQNELRDLVTAAGFSIVEKSYIWPSFEDISGDQPRLVRLVRPALRQVADLLESLPGLARFGVSQVLVCKKQ